MQFQHRSKQDVLFPKTVLSEKTAIRRMYQLQVSDEICIYCGIGSGIGHLIYKIRLGEPMNWLKLVGCVIK